MFQLIQSSLLEPLLALNQDGDPDIQKFQSQLRDQSTMQYHLPLAHQVLLETAMEILSHSLLDLTLKLPQLVMSQPIQSSPLEPLLVPNQDGDPDIQKFQYQSLDQSIMLYHLLLAIQVHSVTAMEILNHSLLDLSLK
jgi:hypothetical protein